MNVSDDAAAARSAARNARLPAPSANKKSRDDDERIQIRAKSRQGGRDEKKRRDDDDDDDEEDDRPAANASRQNRAFR